MVREFSEKGRWRRAFTAEPETSILVCVLGFLLVVFCVLGFVGCSSARREQNSSSLSLPEYRLFYSDRFLSQFTEDFDLVQASVGGWTGGVALQRLDHWRGVIRPKRPLAVDCLVHVVFEVETDGSIISGVNPTVIAASLRKMCDIPYVRDIVGQKGQLSLYVSGNCLNWHAEEVTAIILALGEFGVVETSRERWMEMSIDTGSDSVPRTIVMYRPMGETYSVVTAGLFVKASWRQSWQESAGINERLNRRILPIVNDDGVLQLRQLNHDMEGLEILPE